MIRPRGLMHSYHIVAELRQFDGELNRLTSATIDLDVQVTDFLAQCVAVEPKKIGRADLIAACRGQRRGQQWNFDLLENPVIKARRGRTVRGTGEMRR